MNNDIPTDLIMDNLIAWHRAEGDRYVLIEKNWAASIEPKPDARTPAPMVNNKLAAEARESARRTHTFHHWAAETLLLRMVSDELREEGDGDAHG